MANEKERGAAGRCKFGYRPWNTGYSPRELGYPPTDSPRVPQSGTGQRPVFATHGDARLNGKK
jgi:hypothetical protein